MRQRRQLPPVLMSQRARPDDRRPEPHSNRRAQSKTTPTGGREGTSGEARTGGRAQGCQAQEAGTREGAMPGPKRCQWNSQGCRRAGHLAPPPPRTPPHRMLLPISHAVTPNRRHGSAGHQGCAGKPPQHWSRGEGPRPHPGAAGRGAGTPRAATAAAETAQSRGPGLKAASRARPG